MIEDYLSEEYKSYLAGSIGKTLMLKRDGMLGKLNIPASLYHVPILRLPQTTANEISMAKQITNYINHLLGIEPQPETDIDYQDIEI